MKCKKCHTTMEKDSASRTVTCPCCGRTVHYRTKAEKRCNNNYYSSNDNGNGGKRKGHGCLIFVVVVIILLVLSPILLLRLIFGSGIWAVLGGAVSFWERSLQLKKLLVLFLIFLDKIILIKMQRKDELL